MTLVDEALSKIVHIGTVGAMKWLHEATKEKAAKVCDGMSSKYCRSAIAIECAAAVRSME